MSYFDEDGSADILRYIAEYMKGYKYKDNANKENLILMEEGLIYYTINKLEKFGIHIDEKKKENVSLYDVVTMLDKIISKKAKKTRRNDEANKAVESYFSQYLQAVNLVLTAMQDYTDIDLKICDGKNVEVIRRPEDNAITNINIGKNINPKDRIVELMNTLNNVYEKELSK